jgi:hypothetical protein
MERKDLGSPDDVIIRVDTNDEKKARNVYFVVGDVYALVATAEKKLPKCRLVLSGVLRRSVVSWRGIGTLNDRFDWIANVSGLTFVDPEQLDRGLGLR